MGRIAFIRHAQASFFSDDYDELSAHGRRQADLLGQHWKKQDRSFAEVFVGPRRRHRQTAAIAIAACGGTSVELIELPEFDEHQVDRLVLEHKSSLVEEFPQLKELVNSLESAPDRSEQVRRFQLLFEAVAGLWVSRAIALPGIELWPDFQARVNRGITKALENASENRRHGRQIAVFSSVGPIAIAFQRATGCSDGSAMETGWRLRNCSVTQALFSGERFTLDTFNSLAHLPDPGDWTFR